MANETIACKDVCRELREILDSIIDRMWELIPPHPPEEDPAIVLEESIRDPEMLGAITDDLMWGILEARPKLRKLMDKLMEQYKARWYETPEGALVDTTALLLEYLFIILARLRGYPSAEVASYYLTLKRFGGGGSRGE